MAPPVTRSRASTRGSRLPTDCRAPFCLVSTALVLRSLPPCSGQNGVDYFVIAGTAADVAGDGMTHVLHRGRGIVVEQNLGGHDNARRAEAALRAAVRDQRLLNGMQLSARRQAFDSDDVPAG